MNKTVLYYTSNREDPVFEKKIRDNILKQKGNLPLVSVSQKPIDFGENICVGEVGLSYINEFQQILIGAKRIKTEYTIFAESDYLYPESYFKFDPVKDIYLYDNIWIVFYSTKFGGFCKKKYSDGAQICRTKFLVDRFEAYLKDKPKWMDGNTIKFKELHPFFRCKRDWFTGDPCVSFKTGKGVRWITNITATHTDTLPPWGNINDLRKEYL